MYQTSGTKQVGVVGVSLGAVHERPEPVNFDQTERPEDGVEADGQVQKVQRQQTQTVDVERRRVHVVVPQFGRVRLQNAILEVACPKVHRDVQQVQNVRKIVQAKPQQQRLARYFLERKPAAHKYNFN